MSRSHWLSVACVALIAALAGPAPASAQSGLFGEVVAVRARAVAHRSQVSPGDRLVVAVEMHHEEGFHTWPSAPVVPPEFGADFPAIATTIDVVTVPPDTVVHPIQWPAPVPVTVYYTGAPVPLESYAGTIAAYAHLRRGIPVTEGDRVVIRRAAHPARLLHPEGYDYFAMLREKLHWSETPERLKERRGA